MKSGFPTICHQPEGKWGNLKKTCQSGASRTLAGRPYPVVSKRLTPIHRFLTVLKLGSRIALQYQVEDPGEDP